jgi:heterodisulfide reductase subunit B
MGAEPVEKYDGKVSCCGGADIIVTPCPVCQMNVGVCKDRINAKYGTGFNIPVT